MQTDLIDVGADACGALWEPVAATEVKGPIALAAGNVQMAVSTKGLSVKPAATPTLTPAVCFSASRNVKKATTNTNPGERFWSCGVCVGDAPACVVVPSSHSHLLVLCACLLAFSPCAQGRGTWVRC